MWQPPELSNYWCKIWCKISLPVVAGLGLFLASTVASAERLNVVEMFTSQSCYSCPAADKLLHEKASTDESILNLEFHVDYWNKLRYGSAGIWVDPYSSEEYTIRQQRYAGLNLSGNNGVYTPQAVVNGTYGLVGSDRYEFNKGLRQPSARPVEIDLKRVNDASLSVAISSESSTDADVYIVHFLLHTKTDVPTGENHGKLMENHNVVIDMQSLGSVNDIAAQPVEVAYASQENRGCAIIVQNPRLGPILGAARCP